MKKISIIIPVYNAEKYVERGLSSIVHQTIFEKLDVIIINDGSTDKSLKLCEQYSEKYENIEVFSKENGGVSSARNLGLEKVKTKYVCFFDIDDTVELDMYEKLLDIIEIKKVDIAMVDFSIIYNNGCKKKKRKSIKETIEGKNMIVSFFKGGIIGNNIFDKIFSYEIIGDVRFYDGKAVGEDMHFIYEVLKNARDIFIDTSYSGYNYYQNEISAMNSVFSPKFFDTIFLSKLMVDDYDVNTVLYEYAYAHLIHEVCKVNEYILLHDPEKKYEKEKQEIRKEIKSYSLKKAYKYLSHRHFAGLLLMKISQRMYMFFYRVMKIG